MLRLLSGAEIQVFLPRLSFLTIRDDVMNVGLSIEMNSGESYQTIAPEELPKIPFYPGVQLRRIRLTQPNAVYRVRLILNN